MEDFETSVPGLAIAGLVRGPIYPNVYYTPRQLGGPKGFGRGKNPPGLLPEMRYDSVLRIFFDEKSKYCQKSLAERHESRRSKLAALGETVIRWRRDNELGRAA
jgi:hypothetical protein